MNGRLWFSIAVVAAALGCGDAASSGTDDGAGDPGGRPSLTTDPLCKVKTQDDGSKLITCDDGTTATVRDGEDGEDGTSCSVADNGDGTKSISCADGTIVAVSDGAQGEPGTVNPATFCPAGMIDGDYVIVNSVDAALIAGCSTITGNLVVGWGISNLSLPSLATVNGTVRIQNIGIRSISLPVLGRAWAFELRGSEKLTNLSLPALSTIETTLVVEGNAALSNLSLPALSTVGGSFAIKDNPKLPTAQATAIRNQLVNFTGMTTISGNLP